MSNTKTFVSGGLRLSVKFNDRTDQYQVRMCSKEEKRCRTEKVRPPRSSKLSVDSTLSMLRAARAAISFAPSDWSDRADFGSSGAIVKPARKARK